MKTILRLLLFALMPTITANVYSQTDSVANELKLKEKILNDIQLNFNTKTTAIDSTIKHIDLRVDKLDSLIKTASSSKELAQKLYERVQVVEDKQKAIEQNELNVYQANYQSALINLLSMDREIKPLLLFNSTKNFFAELSQVSNPSTYSGFDSWFKQFRNYIDKNSEKDIYLKTLNGMVNVTQTVTATTPLVGGASQIVFSGMASYINSISKRQKDLKKESENMFQLIISLNQFDADRNKIENNWQAITESLDKLQKQYNDALKRNLKLVNVKEKDFEDNFSNENDADKRYLYLTTIRNQAAETVSNFKKDNAKDWKEKLYYELISIRDLKLKYGEVTTEINDHISLYETLIGKYKKNSDLSARMAMLETKLNNLRDTFDKTFDPAEYIHSANRMYKVM
jgi:hypothetical protein